MKDIIDNQDEYIQELETQVIKMHGHMTEMEGQLETFQDIIEYLLKKCNNYEAKQDEKSKEMNILSQFF